MNARRIYLAGPMTGIPEHNVPAFETAAAQLRALGYDVVSPPDITRANPVDSIGADGSISPAAYAALFRLDLLALLDCAAVVVLDGWFSSRGVRIELAIAKTIGLPAFEIRSFLGFGFDAPRLTYSPYVAITIEVPIGGMAPAVASVSTGGAVGVDVLDGVASITAPAPRRSGRPDCSACGIRMEMAGRGDGSHMCTNDNCAKYREVVGVPGECDGDTARVLAGQAVV